MVKNTKYIIMRIIIGVGIALALCFLTNISVVQAETNINPSSLCVMTDTSSSCSVPSLTTYQVFDRTFYGYTNTGAEIQRGRVGWIFNSNDNIKNQNYDIDFVLFLQGTSSYLDSTRGYIQNGSNNIYSCYIDNTRYGAVFNGNTGSTNTTADGSTVVHCSNVYLTDTSFRFYLLDFNVRNQGVVAISPITLHTSTTQAIQNEVSSMNDAINDNNISSGTSSTVNDLLEFQSQSNFGPVADLLLLPLTLFGALYSGFSGSCSSVNLGTLLNHNIILPCINLQNILGSGLYTTIDLVISIFMIYNIILMCINIFDKITSLNDPFQEIYNSDGGDK